MGWRFRKSIQIVKGVRLNLSNRGPSVSAGIPGTGLYWTSRGSGGGKRDGGATQKDVNGCLALVVLGAGAMLVGSCFGPSTPTTSRLPESLPVAATPTWTPADMPAPASAPASSILNVGDLGRLSEPGRNGVWLAADTSDVEPMRQALARERQGGPGAGADSYRLAEARRIRIYPQETLVEVIASRNGLLRVRVSGGEDDGETGWTPSAHVVPVVAEEAPALSARSEPEEPVYLFDHDKMPSVAEVMWGERPMPPASQRVEPPKSQPARDDRASPSFEVKPGYVLATPNPPDPPVSTPGPKEFAPGQTVAVGGSLSATLQAATEAGGMVVVPTGVTGIILKLGEHKRWGGEPSALILGYDPPVKGQRFWLPTSILTYPLQRSASRDSTPSPPKRSRRGVPEPGPAVPLQPELRIDPDLIDRGGSQDPEPAPKPKRRPIASIPSLPGISGSLASGICGAPTRSGAPCQRRVRGGGYCYQHR